MTDPKSQSAVQRDIEREQIGRIMHESWSRTKRAQGFHGPNDPCCAAEYGFFPCGTKHIRAAHCKTFHANLIPWEDLPEKQKDINRHAFDAVLESGLFVSSARLREVEQERDVPPSADEGVCGDCGVSYPVWFAPNPVWNKVITAGVGMLCPTCFMKRGGGSWEVRPDWFHPPEVCTCETPRESWNPAEPCLACGGKLRDQETSNQSPAPPSSQGQDAAPEGGTVALPATSERSEDSRQTLSAESRLAQAGKLAEAARPFVDMETQVGMTLLLRGDPELARLRTALSDFDKL